MPQSGQLWSTAFQMGKETVSGTAVAATRIIYFNADGTLTRTRAQNEHRFAVGRRDNVLAYTNGPIQAGGSVGMPVSAEEMAELLAISIQGGVTPTTPTGATAGRQWVFKPSNTVDSVTLEWDDGARAWRETGVKGNSLQIQGAVGEQNMVTCDLFGADIQQNALTGALASRVPTFIEGWQTVVYADAFGTAPGQTQIPSFLRNWQVQVSNQLNRLYLAGNTLSANRITQGELQVSASLTVDAASAQAATEFANWDAGTKRVIRLEFLGTRAQYEAAINEAQTITAGTATGGTFTLVVLGQPTAAIAFNASAATVQTAINNALAVFGTGYTVTCTGGPIGTGAVTVTSDGAALAGRNVPQIALGTNSLTGGTAPALATTVQGYYGGPIVQVDIPGAWTAVDLTGANDGVRTYAMSLASVYEPTSLAAMVAFTLQNNRTALYA